MPNQCKFSIKWRQTFSGAQDGALVQLILRVKSVWVRFPPLSLPLPPNVRLHSVKCIMTNRLYLTFRVTFWRCRRTSVKKNTGGSENSNQTSSHQHKERFSNTHKPDSGETICNWWYTWANCENTVHVSFVLLCTDVICILSCFISLENGIVTRTLAALKWNNAELLD